MHEGITGTARPVTSAPMPFRKRPMAPVVERVPSGKTMTSRSGQGASRPAPSLLGTRGPVDRHGVQQHRDQLASTDRGKK
jgi:hypothetical protein